MKRSVALVLSSLLLAVASAWGQPMMGTVYGVYPEGVMVQQPGGAILVPTQHASFEMGGVRLNYSQVLPGQAISPALPTTGAAYRRPVRLEVPLSPPAPPRRPPRTIEEGLRRQRQR